MQTLIITKVTNRKDAEMLYSISKRFGKAKLLRGKEQENLHLAQLMEEAMESETISLEKVHKELRK